MSVPTDNAIRQAAEEILKGCDVLTTTLKIVRTQLEERFQCSLSDKKSIIYESFDKFLAQNEDILKYNDIVKAENETTEADGHDATADNGATAKKGKARGGFAADVHVTPELAEFLGIDVLPRTEVTKRIWAYIREHGLQDPRDKRKILCDEALEKVLKRKSIHMFTMTKVLSSMMRSPKEMSLDLPEASDNESEADSNDSDGDDDEDEEEAATRAKKASKTNKVKTEKPSTSSGKKDKSKDKQKEKDKKKAAEKKKRKATSVEDGDGEDGTENGRAGKKAKKASAFTISDALCEVLGMQSDDSRTEVVKKMWEYIRAHNLQNPADKREIRLDAALQEVFKVKTFNMFSMNKHIAKQMMRNE